MNPCKRGHHTLGRYRDGGCIECRRISYKDPEIRFKARIRSRARHDADPAAWNSYYKKYRQEKKQELVLYKGGKCQDCGGIFPLCCYDFDHRNPFDKAFAISQKTGRSMEELKKEVDKCDLVCRNCHAVRTSLNPQISRKMSLGHAVRLPILEEVCQ